MPDVSRADAEEGRPGPAQRRGEHLLDAELGNKRPVSPVVVRGSAALKGNLDGRCCPLLMSWWLQMDADAGIQWGKYCVNLTNNLRPMWIRSKPHKFWAVR